MYKLLPTEHARDTVEAFLLANIARRNQSLNTIIKKQIVNDVRSAHDDVHFRRHEEVAGVERCV